MQLKQMEVEVVVACCKLLSRHLSTDKKSSVFWVVASCSSTELCLLDLLLDLEDGGTSSETSLNFCRATRRYRQEDGTRHSYHCETLKSNISINSSEDRTRYLPNASEVNNAVLHNSCVSPTVMDKTLYSFYPAFNNSVTCLSLLVCKKEWRTLRESKLWYLLLFRSLLRG
jgi:hypothetical protein